MFALDEYLEVPYSNKNYFIDKVGNVVDSVYHHIPKKIGDDGRSKVMMNWLNGPDYYDLALVICISYYRPNIPPYLLLNEIEVYFSDNVITNCNINNLYYKFKSKRLEVPNIPGLYYIPYNTQYALDKEYNLYKLSSRNGIYKMSWYQESNKYYRNRKVEDDFSKVSGMMRHRAIGLVFIDYPNNPLKLQINHMNGIKGDDREDNLEWVTHKENIIHAGNNGLLRHFTGAIDVKRIHDEEEYYYDSVRSASEKLRIHPDLINEQLGKKTLEFIPTKGYLFKLAGDDWPIYNDAKKKYKGKYAIIAKNVFTNEGLIFNGLKDASEKLNIPIGSINFNYSKNSIIPTSGYIFRDITVKNWPIYTFYHLSVYKKILINKTYPKAYFFINKKKQKFMFFVGVEEIMNHLNISKRQVYNIFEIKRYESYSIMEFDYSKEMDNILLNELKKMECIYKAID